MRVSDESRKLGINELVKIFEKGLLMLSIKKWVMLIFCCLLVACAVKRHANVDYDETFNFSQLKSYAWIESTDASKVSTLDNKRDRNAIETRLNQKGFVKAQNSADASFLLKMHTITDTKVSVERFYSAWGYYPSPFYSPLNHWPRGSSTVVNERKVANVVLDIVDPKQKQVIWRGAISRPLGIYKRHTPTERANLAMQSAEYLLLNFPPQAPSQN